MKIALLTIAILFLIVAVPAQKKQQVRCTVVNGVELGQTTKDQRDDGWQTLRCGKRYYSTDLYVFRGCTEVNVELRKNGKIAIADVQPDGCEALLRPPCGTDDEAGIKPGLMKVPCRRVSP